jgi:hypothetical protein
MLDFIFTVLAAAITPLSIGAGLFVGYLFFKDWKQLAWGLLLFVIPGIGGMDALAKTHGVFYAGAAQFIAISTLAFLSFQMLEYFANRRQASKREA